MLTLLVLMYLIIKIVSVAIKFLDNHSKPFENHI